MENQQQSKHSNKNYTFCHNTNDYNAVDLDTPIHQSLLFSSKSYCIYKRKVVDDKRFTKIYLVICRSIGNGIGQYRRFFGYRYWYRPQRADTFFQKYLKISKKMKIMLISIISVVFVVGKQRFACSMKSDI